MLHLISFKYLEMKKIHFSYIIITLLLFNICCVDNAIANNNFVNINTSDTVVVTPRDTVINSEKWFEKNGGKIKDVQSTDSIKERVDGNNLDRLSEEWFKKNSIAYRENKEVQSVYTNGRGTDVNIAVSDVIFDISDVNGWFWGRSKKESFRARWSFIDIGVNSLMDTSYDMYGVSNDFMDINNNKSIEFAINFCKLGIGLSKHNNKIGLMTGLGITWNNYRFNQAVTIESKNGIIVPKDISDQDVIKSKLVSSYLSIPLMLQYRIPIEGRSNSLWLSAGLTGEIKLGSHTKIKTDSGKYKDFDDLQLVPFRYSYTARASYGILSLYVKYYQPGLFQSNKGPNTTPLTFGIGLL